MKEMTCIVCPNGCSLVVDDSKDPIEVSGNKCPRGKQFAINELIHPMRTICSTVKTTYHNVPVVPVRVTSEIPKEQIFPVMKEINQVLIKQPLGVNDVVIENVLGLGVDVIITSNILKEGEL